MRNSTNHLITIVDDNLINLELVKELLYDEPFEIQLIEDSKQALSLMLKQMPDLILLDIMMPEVDGFDICTKLKSNPYTKHIPIIFLTAVGDDEVIDKAFMLGATDYITKPFKSAELIARIKNQISIISFQKRLKKELEERKKVQERYRLAQEASNIGTWEWEYESDVLSFSSTGHKIFGLQKAHKRPLKLIDKLKLIHPDDKREYLKKQDSLKARKTERNVTEFRVLKDNETKYFREVSELKFNKEKKAVIIGVVEDITKRKITEEALIQSEFNFKNIFNKSNDVIIIWAPDGESILDANEKACQLFEYSKKELLKLSLSQIKTIEEAERHLQVFKRLSENEKYVFETTCLSKSGKEIPLEVSSIITNYYGKQVVLCNARDITERKENAKRLLSAIIDAEENERLRIAQDLHDGLGPLMSMIKIHIEWALKPDKKANRTEILQKTQENVSEAYRSLKDISNHLSPHILQNFGLISALKSYADKIKESKNIEIDIQSNLKGEKPGTTDMIIYRVFTEAINNTLKHAKATKIDVSIHKTKDKLVAKYSDNGIGFDVEKTLELKKGMGLYNIINRIQSIDGNVEILSIPGKGSQINLQI